MRPARCKIGIGLFASVLILLLLTADADAQYFRRMRTQPEAPYVPERLTVPRSYVPPVVLDGTIQPVPETAQNWQTAPRPSARWAGFWHRLPFLQPAPPVGDPFLEALPAAQEGPVLPSTEGLEPLPAVPQPDVDSAGVDCIDCATELPVIALIDPRAVWTWLPGEGNVIGFHDVDVRATVAFPRLRGLLVSPRLVTHLVDGPRRTDLPGQLYEASVEFAWKKQATPRLGYELAVAPGVYSDFQQSNSDALRITGRGVAIYGLSYVWQIVLGVAYLDRNDVRLLPVFGVIYAPNDDARAELVFPQPKIARRYLVRENFERWLYLKGEFGGNSWAVERVGGANDVATYSDWRLLTGIETRYQNGRVLFFEVGYVFNRELEYQSGIGDFDVNDTGLFRVGLQY